MKIRNVVFSGFMAAILGGFACSADAAVVASKEYVDAREDAIVAGVETNYLKKTDAETTYRTENQVASQISTAIANKADKATTLAGYGITDAYTKEEVDKTFETIENVNKKVKVLADTLGEQGPDGETGIVATVTQHGEDITDLQTTTTQQGEKITALEGKVGNDTVENQITAALGTYTTENGINGLSAKVQTNIDNISALQTTLADGGDIKNEIEAAQSAANAAQADADTNAAAITVLNGADTVDGSVKKQIKVANEAQTQTITDAYKAYALPKPENCKNTTCVLSVDGDGNPYWMQLWLSGEDGNTATTNL